MFKVTRGKCIRARGIILISEVHQEITVNDKPKPAIVGRTGRKFRARKRIPSDLSRSGNSLMSSRRSTPFFAALQIGLEGISLALSRIKPAVSGTTYNSTYRTSPYNLTSARRIRTLLDIEMERQNYALRRTDITVSAGSSTLLAS